MVPEVSWDAFRLVSAKPLAEIAVTEMVAGKRLVLMVPVVRAEALRAPRFEPVPEKFAEISTGSRVALIVPKVSWDAFRLVSAKPLAEIEETDMVDGRRDELIVPFIKAEAFRATIFVPFPINSVALIFPLTSNSTVGVEV